MEMFLQIAVFGLLLFMACSTLAFWVSRSYSECDICPHHPKNQLDDEEYEEEECCSTITYDEPYVEQPSQDHEGTYPALSQEWIVEMGQVSEVSPCPDIRSTP